MHRVRKKVSQPVQRNYTGKGLFGKLKGTFVFRPKSAKPGAKQMKLPLSLLIFYFLLSTLAFAGDDKSGVIRDANGQIISRVDRTATGTTARDAAGAVTEHRSSQKNTDGSQTVTVRDASGKVIRIEEKKR
jgi:YD repeat-containing protein